MRGFAAFVCALAVLACLGASPVKAGCHGGGQVGVFNAPVIYQAPVAVQAAPVYVQQQLAFAAPVQYAPAFSYGYSNFAVQQQAVFRQKNVGHVQAAPVVFFNQGRARGRSTSVQRSFSRTVVR